MSNHCDPGSKNNLTSSGSCSRLALAVASTTLFDHDATAPVVILVSPALVDVLLSTTCLFSLIVVLGNLS